MKSFKLVNPLIVGNFNTEYTSESGLDAVSQFWNDFSSHITSNVPHIYVTLQEGGSEKLTHYKISEKTNNKSKTAEFSIAEYNLDLSSSQEKKFLNEVNKYEKKVNSQISRQVGGDPEKKPERKRYNASSSSSSDSDSDDEYFNFGKYRRLTQPISFFYYTPSIYKVNSVFLPTFNVPLTPYVKLWLPMY
mgnify:FL=1|jgi:hypothetical protein